MQVCESSLDPIDANNMNTQFGLPSYNIACSIDQHSKQQSKEDVHAVGVNIAQYNCQTMLKNNDRECLLEATRYCKIGVLALQETRMNSAGVSIVEDFISCKSSAINGNHGCEILINTNTPWFIDGENKICICSDDVSIVMHTDRYIVVRATIAYTSCYLVDAHAPYQGCDEDPIQWWVVFLAEFKKKEFLVMPVLCSVGITIVNCRIAVNWI